MKSKQEARQALAFVRVRHDLAVTSALSKANACRTYEKYDN